MTAHDPKDFGAYITRLLAADPVLAAEVAYEIAECERESQWYWERVEAAATTEEDDED
jgi:hypothetical protein